MGEGYLGSETYRARGWEVAEQLVSQWAGLVGLKAWCDGRGGLECNDKAGWVEDLGYGLGYWNEDSPSTSGMS